jgi:hypothetical protein
VSPIMKVSHYVLFAILCLSHAVARAKDAELQTPTTVTGTVSGKNPDFYISSGDTVSSRPGWHPSFNHEPARHCLLSLDALDSAKKKELEQELTKKAASGQPITLHGEYFPLKDRGETTQHHVAFEVKE